MSSVNFSEMDHRLKRIDQLFTSWNEGKAAVATKLAGQLPFDLGSLERIEEEVAFTQRKFMDMTHVFKEVGGGYAELFEKVRQGCFQSRQGFFGLSVADSITWVAGLAVGASSTISAEDLSKYADPLTLKVSSLILFVLSQIFSKYNDVSSTKNIHQLQQVQAGLFKVTQILDQKKVLDKVGEISCQGEAIIKSSSARGGIRPLEELLSEWKGLKKSFREDIKQFVSQVDPVVFFDEEAFAGEFEKWRLNSLGVAAVLGAGQAVEESSSNDVVIDIDGLQLAALEHTV